MLNVVSATAPIHMSIEKHTRCWIKKKHIESEFDKNQLCQTNQLMHVDRKMIKDYLLTAHFKQSNQIDINLITLHSKIAILGTFKIIIMKTLTLMILMTMRFSLNLMKSHQMNLLAQMNHLVWDMLWLHLQLLLTIIKISLLKKPSFIPTISSI